MARNPNELYLMSAILHSSIIYELTYKDNKLIITSGIPVLENRFLGTITIENITQDINFQEKKLDILLMMTLNHQNEIEIQTLSQFIHCPISSINLHFSYDEEKPI